MPYFDVAILESEGIKLPHARIHDTRFMAHVLESTGSTALKNLAARFVDPRAAVLQQSLDAALHQRGDNAWTWATIPIDFQEYWAYAGLDPILTVQLYEYLWPKVQADAPKSYELELAVSWVTMKMQGKGVRIDREYTQDLSDKLTKYATEVRTWLRETYGLANPGSNDQVVKALLREGVELTKRTASGAAFSVAKDVLETIDHPMAEQLRSMRHAERMVGTYLDTYLKLSEADGRIHPSINVIGGTAKNNFESGGTRGVRTGRMSMNDPNLQFVPVRTLAGKRIRRAFVPDDDTHGWCKADADQIEMRVLAHMADDEPMRQAFIAPGDFFVNMAREIFQDPTIEKSDPRRQPVKNSGYAIAYGAGLEQFALTAGMRTEDGELDIAGASAFMHRLSQTYPGMTGFPKEVERIGRRNQLETGDFSMRSPLTNRKHVADRGREYALTNYLIQGTAGELLKIKMVEVAQAGLDEFALYPVHDEINFSIPRDQLDDATQTLREILDDDKILSVPLTWSIETGPDWGSCE
jgi:DNA polymerase-1